MFSTGAVGPVRAATPALWMNPGTHVIVCSSTFTISRTRGLSATSQPSLHPVIAYVFENPWTVTVRSNIPSREAGETCRPSYRIFS